MSEPFAPNPDDQKPPPKLDYFEEAAPSSLTSIGFFVLGLMVGFPALWVGMLFVLFIGRNASSGAFGIVISIFAVVAILGGIVKVERRRTGKRNTFLIGLLAGMLVAALLWGTCFVAIGK